jgi:hypothetical protein
MAYQGNVPAEAYTTTAKDTFNGNGSTTAFTLSLPTVTNDIRVVVENVVQEPTAAYSVSGTTLTFTAAPPSGTGNVYVVHLGPAVQTVEPPSTIAGATTFASTVSAQSDLLFPDNSKAIFGAGSDLQIYHSGSHSVIKDAGDGNLQLIANDFQLRNGADNANMMTGANGGAVTLMHNGSSKLATTATGIDVTGDITPTGGVYLGGTGAANYLDDYEEGTWTPTLNFGIGSIGYGWNLGQYTKVGNQVSVTFAISINSISSPSGTIDLAGLPFASGSGEQYVSSITFGLIRGLTSDQKTVRGYLANAQSFAPLSVNATNAGYSGLNASQLTTSTFLYGSIVYQTS